MWATHEEVESRLKVIEDAHARGWPGRVARGTWWTTLWFGLPFLAMWGLDIEPTIAARAAVAPAVIAIVALVFVSSMAALFTSASYAWIRSDAKFAELQAKVADLEGELAGLREIDQLVSRVTRRG